MKWNGGDVRLELVMDDFHDRRVKGHADPQQSTSVSHLFQSFAKIPDRLGAAAQDDLGR